MNISSSQVSVVFQGAARSYVGEDRQSLTANIRRTRNVLPNSTIILSTWEDTELPKNLAVDMIVRSMDPGALPGIKFKDTAKNNINRQIISSRKGIAHVRTPYTIKLRTDSYLEHAGFLDYFNRYASVIDVDRRIIANSFFTIDPQMFEHIPFHISDWVQFGATSQLASLWQCPLFLATDADYYDRHPHPSHYGYFERQFRTRMAVEQYIYSGYAESLGYQTSPTLMPNNQMIYESALAFMRERMILLNPSQIGVVMPKYQHIELSLFQRMNCFMHLDWLALIDQKTLMTPYDRRVIKKRRRQKQIIRILFKLSVPLHRLIFETKVGLLIRALARRALRY